MPLSQCGFPVFGHFLSVDFPFNPFSQCQFPVLYTISSVWILSSMPLSQRGFSILYPSLLTSLLPRQLRRAEGGRAASLVANVVQSPSIPHAGANRPT